MHSYRSHTYSKTRRRGPTKGRWVYSTYRVELVASFAQRTDDKIQKHKSWTTGVAGSPPLDTLSVNTRSSTSATRSRKRKAFSPSFGIQHLQGTEEPVFWIRIFCCKPAPQLGDDGLPPVDVRVRLPAHVVLSAQLTAFCCNTDTFNAVKEYDCSEVLTR